MHDGHISCVLDSAAWTTAPRRVSWQALPKMDLFGQSGKSLFDFDDLGMHDFVRWGSQISALYMNIFK